MPETYVVVTPERVLRPLENTRTHKPRASQQNQVIRRTDTLPMEEGP